MATAEPSTPSTGVQHIAPQITAQQKQKLIDDLQSELTLRARELRSRAAMKAQSITSTIENRIMTVPSKLRKTTIGELLDGLQPAALTSDPPANSTGAHLHNSSHVFIGPITQLPDYTSHKTTKKRTSDEMLGSDKENQAANIDVQKKRARVAALSKGADAKAARTTSRKVDPAQILSPKSHNSRTLPQSPLKGATSDTRYYASRPNSPVKTASTPAATSTTAAQQPAKTRVTKAKTAASKAVGIDGTAATRTKRAPPSSAVGAIRTANHRITSGSSTTSTVSTGTTIVTKKAATAKKGVMGKVQGIASAAGRKVAAARKDAAPPEAGKRVLRSRK